MSQKKDVTPNPVTVYSNMADLELCYPLMWNVTLEYTATHFNTWVRPDQEFFPDLPHTPVNTQLFDADMLAVRQKLSKK